MHCPVSDTTSGQKLGGGRPGNKASIPYKATDMVSSSSYILHVLQIIDVVCSKEIIKTLASYCVSGLVCN